MTWRDQVSEIFGWIDPIEQDCLFDLAAKCERGVIVEIGSFKGKSTACLGFGSLTGFKRPIFAIDVFQPYFDKVLQVEFPSSIDEFKANMVRLGLHEIVTPIQASSRDAVKNFIGEIGLLFVDACHNFNEVSHDISQWSIKLVSKGILAVHDCAPGGNWIEPQQAFKSLVQDSPSFQFLGFVGSLGVARKL